MFSTAGFMPMPQDGEAGMKRAHAWIKSRQAGPEFAGRGCEWKERFR